MRFSKFLVNGLALCLSTWSLAAADSLQLTRALDDLSTLSEGVKSATVAINRYQGGAVAALPAAKKFYDLWNTLKTATTNLNNDADISPEDTSTLVREVSNMLPMVQTGMEASGSKMPLLDAAGVGFVSRALHDAVRHDLKKYLNAVKSKLSEDRKSQVDDIFDFYEEIHKL
ncbi:hypothetical protein FQN54_003530, partial [Arachnomyces sp. PD_36]